MNLKPLKFREELIELLNKYNYELESNEAGELYINDNSNYYLLDQDNNYSVQNSDGDYLIEKLVNNIFKNSEPFYQVKNIGVFTNSYEKAKYVFTAIVEKDKSEIKQYKQFKNDLIINYFDGRRIRWIKPIESSRGNKVGFAYIDKALTLEELECIVVPCCVGCTKDRVTII